MMDNKPLYDDCAEAYIKFKQFVSQNNRHLRLTEELTDKQKAKTEKWLHFSNVTEQTKDKIEKSLGDRNGYGKTLIPLSHQDVPEDVDVADHLNNHGWKIHNYLDGIAHTTKMVGNPEKGIPMQEKTIKSSIGKVLNVTNAPDHIKNAFANDPVRQTAKTSTSDLRVMISTHPHSIGGSTSGTTWENQSCMNLDNGCNREYLPKEAENGTHIAFLVHKDDHGANHGTVPTAPLARMILKPYHTEDVEHKDTIFRPEKRIYGNAGTSFESTVDEWAKKNYPSKPSTLYRKDRNSYDDTGNTYIESLSKKDVFDKLDSDRRLTNRGVEVDKDTIAHALAYPKEKNMNSGQHSAYVDNIKGLPLKTSHIADIINSMPKLTGNETEGQKNRLLDDNVDSIGNLGEVHGDKFTKSHIEQYHAALSALHPNRSLGYVSSMMPVKVLGSPRLPDHIADSLTPDNYAKLHPSKFTNAHANAIISGYRDDMTAGGEAEMDHLSNITANIDKFKDEHLKQLVSLTEPKRLTSTIRHILNHPNASTDTKKELTNKFINGNGYAGRMTRLHSNQITPEHIHNLKNEVDEFGELHPVVDKIDHLMSNPNLSAESNEAVKNKFLEIPSRDKFYRFGDKLPDHMTRTFSDKDIDSLVADHLHNTQATWPIHGSPEFNNRLMDNVEHKIKTAHQTSLEMVKAGKENTSAFTALGEHTHKLVKIHGAMLYNHVSRHLDPDLSEEAEINAFDGEDAKRQLDRFDLASELKHKSPHPNVYNDIRQGFTDHNDARNQLVDAIDNVKYHHEDNL